jgi:Na+-transporting NADH:ubiquinone oxidoreductase subunit C
MQKDELNTIKFAAIVCLICSMGLAGVKGTLNAKQEYNKKIDQQVNVLKALFPSFTPDGEELDMDRRDELFTQGQVPKEWIPQYFDQFVEIEDIELADGEKGKLYKLKKDDQLKSVAFPAQGKGLWSTVHSYVGLIMAKPPGWGANAPNPGFSATSEGRVCWRMANRPSSKW